MDQPSSSLPRTAEKIEPWTERGVYGGRVVGKSLPRSTPARKGDRKSQVGAEPSVIRKTGKCRPVIKEAPVPSSPIPKRKARGLLVGQKGELF